MIQEDVKVMLTGKRSRIRVVQTQTLVIVIVINGKKKQKKSLCNYVLLEL